MNNARDIAKKIVAAVNAHGDGLSADWVLGPGGYGASVVIRHGGDRIGRVEIDSAGDYEASASRRRGLVFRLIDRGVADAAEPIA